MKKKQNISFRLVSYTDAAGKYASEAVRRGNEDNFYVDDDLTDDTTNRVTQDKILRLGKLGMLMVIADGMGGMNAGEVASQIAVDTVKAAFKSESLSESITATSQSRQKYLEQVIKHADKNIKSEARKDRSREGMGSTIIMAWLFEDELTISWCGDSRAYIFNEKSGIRLISQDHSYVQELVNKGILTYDQTFDHPQNNIITRSLGDPTKDARSESKILKVGKGDIILLCSDGLSGVLRDRKTYDGNGKLLPEENIEDIIKSHTSSMKECREALWAAAERGGWYDNVTAILCQITDGPESLWATVPETPNASNVNNHKKKTWLFIILAFLVVGAIITAFFVGRNSHGQSDADVNLGDSVPSVKVDSVNASEDKTTEVSDPQYKESGASKGKPTVQEQIKQQVKDSNDIVVRPNVLTIIDRGDAIKKQDSKGSGRLTPIEDKLKKEKSTNPIAPTTTPKDNPTENHLNNQ